jgi:hypothetical protein
MRVSMFITYIDYEFYGVLPQIRLHSVLVDMADNGQSIPLLVRYNEDLYKCEYVA